MTEEFQILSSEGLPIRGTLEMPSGHAGALVVIIHGFKGFRQWSFLPWLAEQLARSGIASCRFDMSRNGIGDGDPELLHRLDLFADDTYSQQLSDLRVVLGALEKDSRLSGLPFFLMGHSRGGAIAMLEAPEIEKLRGVIVWSSIVTIDRFEPEQIEIWRAGGTVKFIHARTKQEMSVSPAMFHDFEMHRSELDLGAALERLRAPILVVHGTSDETVPVGESRQIAWIANHSALVVIDGASHTFGAIHPLVRIPSALRIATLVTLRFIHAYS